MGYAKKKYYKNGGAMGCMKCGGEKLLTKMTYGGAYSDMTEPMVQRMRMGGGTHNTYSGSKKK
tara:strand:- start:1542 stop:1730 length:189 start_codon:yes stop_codon:yes gene_type:complete